jgi:hypothetical protein
LFKKSDLAITVFRKAFSQGDDVFKNQELRIDSRGNAERREVKNIFQNSILPAFLSAGFISVGNNLLTLFCKRNVLYQKSNQQLQLEVLGNQIILRLLRANP